ncbi:RNA polymerase sigma-70 factor, ECF subfamily [Pedobacter westerhofensis]|uniref:RNA polymerase sigma-70 factor, ECF subfamily n=1 Tax=Pedobacter westerhofensis TaxID=425512 RepID=A0A521FRX6_9SPHI|nr:sigma-70 family RNA polymerase sigma factor [Pedobacter westerhofensis]SMO98902.1 RNA polymerase sigma-70 factor, ECF subfamily [Pedobacter westerhofensis]
MIYKLSTYSTYTDVKLVSLLVEGDRLAFDEIYERYWKRLYNDTYKRLKSIEKIEEIVQDVFSNLWTSRGKRNIQNIYPYLLTAVRYQVFMLYKKGKSTPEFEEPLEHMILSSLQADSLFNEKELKGIITFWMALQPDKRRAIFQMKYVDEKSTREISEVLGISQKTVQNQLLTSFSSLRDFLSKAMIILSFCPLK